MTPYHTEEIECPQCKLGQHAKVQHTKPFYTYIKECDGCKYLITESDWKTHQKRANTGREPV